MKTKVVSWNAVSEWKWNVKEGDDVCGICHSAYENCCANCTMPGDDCPLIWGKCSHVFHLHCLWTWFDNSKNGERCPMDRSTWETLSAHT
ncbi:MAG: RING/U-box [Benjaminiella poitrasii]|nr:MAG: RING/U-box [Benjaminiella poitrasii]